MPIIPEPNGLYTLNVTLSDENGNTNMKMFIFRAKIGISSFTPEISGKPN